MKRLKTAGIFGFVLGLLILGAAVFTGPTEKDSSAAMVGFDPVQVHVGLSLTRHERTMTKNPIVVVSQDPSVLAVSAGATSIVTGGAVQIDYEYIGLKVGTTILSVYSDGELKGTTEATVTDHVWATEPTVDVPSTCKSEGSQSIHCTCEGCKAIKPGSEQPVPLAPHTWEDRFVTDRQANYFRTGQESVHCSVCGAIDKDSIQVIPKEKLGRAKIKSVKNNEKATTLVTIKMMEGPNRFDFEYATKNNFSNAKKVQTRNTHVKLVNLKVGKTYYFRAKAVLKKTGKTVKGKWSKPKSIKIVR